MIYIFTLHSHIQIFLPKETLGKSLKEIIYRQVRFTIFNILLSQPVIHSVSDQTCHFWTSVERKQKGITLWSVYSYQLVHIYSNSFHSDNIAYMKRILEKPLLLCTDIFKEADTIVCLHTFFHIIVNMWRSG